MTGRPIEIIRTPSDLKMLVKTGERYTVSVEEFRSLRAVVGASGLISWQCFKKDPFGRARSLIVGKYPDMSLSEAVVASKEAVKQIGLGSSPKHLRRKERAASQSLASTQRPIVDHFLEQQRRKLDQGKINQRSFDLDLLSAKYIKEALGPYSFQDFTADTAKLLDQHFPLSGSLSKREKTHKAILKAYNGLPSSVKAQLIDDVPGLLKEHVAIPKPPKRTDQYLPPEEIANFWFRLMSAQITNDLHKDFIVFCLLTGERKSAALGVSLADIDHEKHRVIQIAGKGSGGQPRINILPMAPMLRALVDRLTTSAKNYNQSYLFPQQRKGKSEQLKNLTRLDNSLFDQIGLIQNVKPTPHALRRTLANLAAVVLRSRPIADDHILHCSDFKSKAATHYFDNSAKEFIEARRQTYAKCHHFIDDLIISSLTPVGHQGDGIVDGVMIAVPDFLESKTHGQRLMLNIESDQKVTVESPLGSFCADRKVFVELNGAKRPRSVSNLQDDATDKQYRNKFKKNHPSDDID